MPYSQVKVYSDGSHYIGIPYEPNPRAKNRRPRYEEVIEVKEPSEEIPILTVSNSIRLKMKRALTPL